MSRSFIQGPSLDRICWASWRWISVETYWADEARCGDIDQGKRAYQEQKIVVEAGHLKSKRA